MTNFKNSTVIHPCTHHHFRIEVLSVPAGIPDPEVSHFLDLYDSMFCGSGELYSGIPLYIFRSDRPELIPVGRLDWQQVPDRVPRTLSSLVQALRLCVPLTRAILIPNITDFKNIFFTIYSNPVRTDISDRSICRWSSAGSIWICHWPIGYLPVIGLPGTGLENI